MRKQFGVGAILIASLMLVTSAVAAQPSATSARLVKPAGMVIPINSYYGGMFNQAATSPYRVERVALSAHELLRSGVCVYNSSGVSLGEVERTVDTRKGELKVYCPQQRGDHAPTLFIPLAKLRLDNSASMDFQPLLDRLGTQATASVGLTPTSYGTTTRITIHVDRKRHTGQAVVSYKSNPAAAGTKQLKMLTFVSGAHGETVRKVWY